MLLLGVFALGAILATSAPGPRREAVRYVLAESTKSVTPAGERASAVRGTVTVLDGTARWDLETGTFPRTRSSSIVLGDRGGWLVDRKAAVAARAGVEDFRALFVPPAEGDAGPFQSAVKDVAVSTAELSKGPDFEGRDTVRLRTTASWSLVTSMPGRVSRVRCRLTAVLDTLEEFTEAVRSPLDDLDRLLDVPADVREALGPELYILRHAPVPDLRAKGSDRLAQAVELVRTGRVHIDPGYDGEFGAISIFNPPGQPQAPDDDPQLSLL